MEYLDNYYVDGDRVSFCHDRLLKDINEAMTSLKPWPICWVIEKYAVEVISDCRCFIERQQKLNKTDLDLNYKGLCFKILDEHKLVNIINLEVVEKEKVRHVVAQFKNTNDLAKFYLALVFKLIKFNFEIANNSRWDNELLKLI